MFNRIKTTIKNYKPSYIKSDLFSGIAVAALIIPVAMGYAQAAGMPPVYGLYTALLPVLAYVIFASSRKVIVGVDDVAAALMVSVLAFAGIAVGSDDALNFIPLVTFFVGGFTIVFAFVRFDKLMTYVSRPVLSGYIFGVALSVFLWQIPKVLGVSMDNQSNSIVGFFSELAGALPATNWLSLAIGAIAIAIILLAQRFLPKIPMPLFVLILATVVSGVFAFNQYGVTIVGEVPQGLPALIIPDFFMGVDKLMIAILGGLAAAIVLTADSLLVSQSFASVTKEKLDSKREVFAFGASNVASGITGSLPTSSSISRTAANLEFKGKTKMVSVVTVIVIALVLLFLSPVLFYMPQPVLSAIVICALIGVLTSEGKKLINLAHLPKREMIIWIASAVGVLIFDVITGILIGVVLSFILLIIAKSAKVEVSFLGVIEGQTGGYDLKHNKDAKPVKHVLIPRIDGSLNFANADGTFSKIKKKMAREDDIRGMIIDLGDVSHLDHTSAESLRSFVNYLESKDIKYYFSRATSVLRNDIKLFGLGDVINAKDMTRTVYEAIPIVKEMITQKDKK